MKRLALIILLISSFVSSVDSAKVSSTNDTTKTMAHKLVLYYKSIGMHPKAEVIEKTIVAVDKYRLKYFPNGEFSRQDFIALAMIESNFHQYEVGSSGEVGIFQIMKSNISKNIENPFEININTKLAMKVLRWKYEECSDYKKTIIAYNGLVYRKGKLSEKYWKAFQKRKVLLEEMEIR